LVDERWTLPPPESQFGTVVLEAFRAKGLTLPRAVVTASLPVRNALAATGRYLTMVPRVALTFPPSNSPLKALPIDLPSTRRPLAIFTLKNRTLSPVVQVFTERARKMAQKQK
jgi:DNA-binding transcriptional LysR family regulator